MSTGLKQISRLGWVIAIALFLCPSMAPPQAQDLELEQAVDVGAEATVSGDAGISDAEEYFRRGVALYKNELYREALSEFNRAVALDPNNANARSYQDKCNGKLRLGVSSSDSAITATTFETIDPESFSQGGETPMRSADEVKRERVLEYLHDASLYMEHQRYSTAVMIYKEVLLIDPDNKDAQDGLHHALIGASAEDIEDVGKQINEDRAMIRKYTEEAKLLPDGANAKGIKEHRLVVPRTEEIFEEQREKTRIEETLESSVSIEFEDIHLNEIVDFIADSYDINIVIDQRSVRPPSGGGVAAAAGTPAGGPAPFPGGPGGPGGPGNFGPGGPGGFQPGGRPGAPGGNFNNNPNARNLNQPGAGGGVGAGGSDPFYGLKSDGVVPYINLKDVTLAEALEALLRPLGLGYAPQPGFIWISKPDIIRRESFEDVETRYYELRNIGSETLFKVVLRAVPVSGFGGSSGGFGGSSGGFGGSSGGFGGSSGGFGGSSGGFGGSSGGFGGGSGGFGGSSGGFGGSSGGFGGRSGGFGGSSGGFGGGGGGFGFGGGGGGRGGGGGGNLGGVGDTVQNISQLFTSINDAQVGEIPATNLIVGLNNAGTGAGSRGRNLGTQPGTGLQTQGAQTGLGGDLDGSPIMMLLNRMIPQVYEPYTNELLSDILYNPTNNMLIVTNTPTNLDKFERQLAKVDVTPKQVSIEAKFLTVRVADLDKIGFKWDLNLTDLNNRSRQIPGLEDSTYLFDVNGDGVDESIPFYSRPDGSNVITNTITDGILGAVVNPGPAQSTFNFAGEILNNEDGSSLGLTFDYLDSLQESELLSAPRVTTMNRKPAVIADYESEFFIVSNSSQVFSTGSGFGGTPETGLVQNPIPQQFNFGIALSVTPQIRDDDKVRLWLNPEVRTKVGEKRFSSTNIIGDSEAETEFILPTISWQSVWTNVIVHDGDTLVLGGLVEDSSIKGEDRMPYISQIPLLGKLFRGNSKEIRQSSLLIFVTPEIIDSTGARFFDVGSSTY